MDPQAVSQAILKPLAAEMMENLDASIRSERNNRINGITPKEGETTPKANKDQALSEGGPEEYKPMQGLCRRMTFMRRLGEGDGLKKEWCFTPTQLTETQQTLLIKRAIMDTDSDLSEDCLIEMETKIDTESVEKFPIAILRQKDSIQVPLEIYVTESTTFRLVRGKGPVVIFGELATDMRDEEDLDMEDDEDEMSEHGVEDDKENNANPNNLNKRKLEEADSTAVKKMKQDAGTDMEAMDDQEK